MLHVSPQDRLAAAARARAFNAGSDARLAGKPMTACPYELPGPMACSWRDGWNDADWYWGRGVGGRWPVRPLPAA